MTNNVLLLAAVDTLISAPTPPDGNTATTIVEAQNSRTHVFSWRQQHEERAYL